MEINIQFIQMPVSESLEAYIEKHLNKLSQKFNWLIKAEVFIKKEKDATPKGNICEIVLSLSGPQIHASSNEENYQLAVKNTISDLKKQLKKRKKIMMPHS